MQTYFGNFGILAALAIFVLAAPVAADGDRVLTFENHCGETVWIGVTGGNIGQTCSPTETCPGGTECGVLTGTCDGGKNAGKPCISNDECVGATCVGKTGHCFWVLPTPSSGSFELADGDTSTIDLTNSPITINAQQQKWSGRVFAKTGCDDKGENCQTGVCPGGECRAGVGAIGPMTLAEFTLLTNLQDSYDVSVINGVNVPIEVAPAANGTAYATTPEGTQGDYWCGNPGGVQASTFTSGKAKPNPNLIGCNWTFANSITVDSTTVAGSSLALVADTGDRCSTDSDCRTDGEVCGRAMGSGASIERRCGTLIGFWTADEVCVFTGNSAGSPFDCTSRVSLYGCSGDNAGSCYTNGAQSSCCGCPDWRFDGKELPATATCKNENPSWASLALPWASFVKAACPSAYSFPYDDPTSTFNCMTTGDDNDVDYTISFCPEGKTVELDGSS